MEQIPLGTGLGGRSIAGSWKLLALTPEENTVTSKSFRKIYGVVFSPYEQIILSVTIRRVLRPFSPSEQIILSLSWLKFLDP